MYRQPNIVYTVTRGDSLFSIAKKYGISVEELKEYNGLETNEVFPGQRLAIPISTYKVRPGDSLYSIAKKFQTTEKSIMKLNNLESTNLFVGEVLQIPAYTEGVTLVDSVNIRALPSTQSEILYNMAKGAKLPILDVYDNWYKVKLFNDDEGWVSSELVQFNVYGDMKPVSSIVGFYTLEEGPTLPSSFNSFINNKESLSEVGLFMFRINADDPTSIEKYGGEFTDEDVKQLIEIGHRNNIKMLAVVHNLLYKDGGTTKAKEAVKELLSTKENRKKFIDNLIELIEKYGFDGVNIDIEDVYIEDSDRLSYLYVELAKELKKKGYYLSASIPSRISDEPFNPFSDPFDYKIIGAVVDEFIVMLYNEFGWPGSPPGPAVTTGWMRKVLDYTISRIPRYKVVGAVSVFGFDFNLDTGKTTYVTYDSAIKLAEKYNANIKFSEERQTPYFDYVDDKGQKHQVWFEDERSLYSKINLAYKKGIKGVALWRLGMEDKDIWPMIKEDVVVKRF
ncbi:LysM peptidoglycan-binding domain-containing protein [Clostridium oceanicum]|uniref:LysM peptidoglycan-binding domain-containing protein n=1 Tax=Clostridium oceanicum TaxID=1543 RepID=A0ABP3UL86_9CLOT